jgi:hypothetical protein
LEQLLLAFLSSKGTSLSVDKDDKYDMSSSDRIHPRQYIRFMEDKLGVHTSDAAKLSAVSSFMAKGQSSQWWDNERKTIFTWDAFVTAFINSMTDTYRREELRQAWAELKQGKDSLDSFYNLVVQMGQELLHDPYSITTKFHYGLASEALKTELTTELQRRRRALSDEELDGDVRDDWYPSVSELYIHAKAHAKEKKPSISAITNDNDRLRLEGQIAHLTHLVAALSSSKIPQHTQPVNIVTWPAVRDGKEKFMPKIDSLPAEVKAYITTNNICTLCRTCPKSNADHANGCPFRVEMDRYYEIKKAASRPQQNFRNGQSK